MVKIVPHVPWVGNRIFLVKIVTPGLENGKYEIFWLKWHPLGWETYAKLHSGPYQGQTGCSITQSLQLAGDKGHAICPGARHHGYSNKAYIFKIRIRFL